MTNRIPTFLSLMALTALSSATLAPAPALAQCALPPLSGKWSGNDGGTYFIREEDSGRKVTWRAQSGDNGRSWANGFEGYRDDRADTITGKWWDVKPPYRHGDLTIKFVDSWNIARTSATGGFGGTHWTRPRGPRGCPDNVAIPAEE
jgi:hypothetical protein